jgi:hypothetical protein
VAYHLFSLEQQIISINIDLSKTLIGLLLVYFILYIIGAFGWILNKIKGKANGIVSEKLNTGYNPNNACFLDNGKLFFFTKTSFFHQCKIIDYFL